MTKDKTKRRTTDKFVNQGSICASVKKKKSCFKHDREQGNTSKTVPEFRISMLCESLCDFSGDQCWLCTDVCKF